MQVTNKFNPQPGDKIICNNGEEFICCNGEFLIKDGFTLPAGTGLIYGYQLSKHKLYEYAWTYWDEFGIFGEKEEWNIREFIPVEIKEVVKEDEPRYTVEEVFYAIKQYVGYESPLVYKDGIKRLLKNLDKDPQYKEYLRLKAIYE